MLVNESMKEANGRSCAVGLRVLHILEGGGSNPSGTGWAEGLSIHDPRKLSTRSMKPLEYKEPFPRVGFCTNLAAALGV